MPQGHRFSGFPRSREAYGPSASLHARHLAIDLLQHKDARVRRKKSQRRRGMRIASRKRAPCECHSADNRLMRTHGDLSKRPMGLSLLRSLSVLNQSAHAWSKAKTFNAIDSPSVASTLVQNISKVPLPAFTLLIAVIEARGKECSENIPFDVTEYWSTITAERSGRAIINAENSAIAIEKTQSS